MSGTARPVQLELPLGLVIPPRRSGPVSRYVDVADELRANAGQWRQIAHRASIPSAAQMAKDIRRGRIGPLVGMEARVRRGYEVWARCPPPVLARIRAEMRAIDEVQPDGPVFPMSPDLLPPTHPNGQHRMEEVAPTTDPVERD